MKYCLAAGVVLLGLLSAPGLVSAAWLNAGMLTMRHAVMLKGARESDVYGLYDAPEPSGLEECSTDSFLRALAWDNSSFAARWALGRASLCIGNANAAAEALISASDGMPNNPILYLDMLAAFSHSGRSDAVVALFENGPLPGPTQLLSDTVALAYQQLGRTDPEALENIQRLRDGDLYANYHLWRAAVQSGNVEVAASYKATLTHFPLQAIYPADKRLLEYASAVIPSLLEEGLWDRGTTLNVVSFLVWQASSAQGVEHMLQGLAASQPMEPEWPFYLGELYHRRGNWERAESAYRLVLDNDPGYSQAYLRLGLVSEAYCSTHLETCGSTEGAVDWYRRYHDLVPNDIVALERLAILCDELAHPEAPALQEELRVHTDDRSIVAEMVGVPVTGVVLGPNLVVNGGVEVLAGGMPTSWMWSGMFSYEPFEAANFAGGPDTLSASTGQSSMRISGFWVQPRKDREPARAGFWHGGSSASDQRIITITAGIPYVLSFDYRTSGVPNNSATVWVSGSPDVFWMYDRGLPSTNGQWHHSVTVGQNRGHTDASIRPMIRLFSTGMLEFDDVQVRQINFSEGVEVQAIDAQFWTTYENR